MAQKVVPVEGAGREVTETCTLYWRAACVAPGAPQTKKVLRHRQVWRELPYQ